MKSVLCIQKIDNIEIIINDKAGKVIENFLNCFFLDIKLDYKYK